MSDPTGPQPGVLRTPDECFASVASAGYPYEPNYLSVEARGAPPVRMHYALAGPSDGPVVLLLHGQPTWSYLYRSVLGGLAARGLRAVAPDLVGFGRSDKPALGADYTLRRHVAWMRSFVDALDASEVTLVVQDWGGPIGLGALAAAPERFARVVATNTALHTSDPQLAGALAWANHGLGADRVVLQESLLDYVMLYQRAREIVPSVFVDAVVGGLPTEVKAAYDAPFPDPAYTAGLRQLTALIPLTRHDPGAAINRATLDALARWRRPFLTAFSDGDPATSGWQLVLRDRVPGARGQAHVTIEGAGHYVQEQRGDALAQVIADFVAAT